ncbi:MAG TPA: hypothetical protein VNJ02_15005 [Vicinamibacterales bacterium]|nr:hypothetical protein [Vicinamibacterales bacterium]
MATGFAVAGWLLLTTSAAARQLPLQPARDTGQSVTAAFEGWYPNPDGSFQLLVGYFNRNLKQAIDIPIGPNNRIDPGGPDYGQPTYFLPRRQWGVVSIKVPKDFGTKRLTWTIAANGQSLSIPIGLIKDYQVEPFKEAAQGNEPPRIQFDPKGPIFSGPPIVGQGPTWTATVGQPLNLDAIATDSADNDPDLTPLQMKQPGVVVVWSKYRGVGEVMIANARPTVGKDGKVSTTATFAAPGEYILRAQVNDRSGEGGGGFQCCWTNAYVKVNVTGSTTK